MFVEFIRRRIAAIDSAHHGRLAQELGGLLEAVMSAHSRWPSEARAIFVRELSSICLRETGRCGEGDEGLGLARDYIPHAIFSALAGVKDLLGPNRMAATQEEGLTVIHLLFKVAEWSVWNYQGRCLFGEATAQRAAAFYFSLPERRCTVWGDKDDVWITLMEYLGDAWGLAADIRAAAPLISCQFYGVTLPGVTETRLFQSAYWKGAPPSLGDAVLHVALYQAAMDQSSVRLQLARGAGPEPMAQCDGAGVLETAVSSWLVQRLGAAEESPPAQERT